jgi:thiol:disulfide interchange protein DsbD
VQATISVAGATKASVNAGLLESWRKKVPQADPDVAGLAWWEKPASGDTRPLILEWNASKPAAVADFYPDASQTFELNGETERVPADPGKTRIRKEVKKNEGDWPKVISGVLVQESGSERQGYAVRVPVQASAAGSNPVSAAASLGGTASPPLGLMLLYAFIGGLILNIMPCVLPVIALKILGFVGQARNDARQARKLGLIYALGVLVSFLLLAGLVIGLQAAGIQFSNPYFLVVMTTLVTLIALNLFGVFEVHLGARTMDTAASLSSRHGASGAFFNGLLATILATSCTAPFLGAAVGFAFAPGQTVIVTLLMFLMVGVGLAFPYVLLTWQPAWLRFVPKPGAWMERFKVAMGFPMLAAAVWLFSLAALFYGERSWWLAVFLVFVALAAWIYGEFVQRQRAWPGIAALAVAIVLVSGYAFALESHLKWRRPIALTAAGSSAPTERGGVAWRPWSPDAVAQARAEHRPVLVDFTAKWCLTCNTVVKPALESASVRKKLQDINAVALLADYTAVPDEMTDELKRFGRAGVPLVLVYPRNPNSPPDVLPEALTSGMVLRALDRARATD